MLDLVAVARAWREDGAAIVRGVLTARVCDQLCTAIERTRGCPSEFHAALSPPGRPVVDSDLFRWRDDPVIRDAVVAGPLPDVAAAVLGTTEVVFVEDQWIASAPGATTATPWHQDAPYYNIDTAFLTLWIALDDVAADAALRVMRRSHLGPTFATVEFATSTTTIGTDPSGAAAPSPPTDPAGELGAEVLSWEMGRGDVIALHSGALHAAGGAAVEGRWFRRLSVRYAPPRARYVDRGPTAATFWQSLPHGLRPGQPLACPTFPLVVPSSAGDVMRFR